MRPITSAIGVVLLLFATVSVYGQSSAPTPPPELKKWDIWIGDWALSGTARDAPSTPEYKVNWSLHERWVLGGFFVQVDQTWKGNGQELHAVEMLSYDTARHLHTDSGFSSDGATWNLTARFDRNTTIEDGTSAGPDGLPTTCHTTFVFTADRQALSGTQECQHRGVRWTAFRVTGRKTVR